MNCTYANSPVYVTADKTAIQLSVKFEELDREVVFVAHADDCEEHGSNLYTRAVQGEFGKIAPYTEEEISLEQKKAYFKKAVTEALNSRAVAMDFDSIDEAMTYVDESAIPLYQTQAIALRKWRSNVWAWYDSIIANGTYVDGVDLETMPKFEI